MPVTEKSKDKDHRVRTLWLVGALHAFTHLYQVALLPLYLLIQKDLGLVSIEQATVLVTAMMLSYFLPSYPMGMLADRFSRKKILGFGLFLNGLGFVGLAYATTYPWALACVIVAGLGGSFYHPAATALVAGLYPVGTGRALGLIGIGAVIGFFLGPIYSGWRASDTGNWHTPVWEMGALGMLSSVLFLWLAQEEAETNPSHLQKTTVAFSQLFPRPALWLFFIGAGFAFSLRDYAGSSMGSLGSLFLQKAQGYPLTQTGAALSSIFLAAIISNPLFGGLSDRGRIRWISVVLAAAALMVFLFPRVPSWGTFPVLVTYGFFFMASFPMIEAALMEAVPPAMRGRVFGFFITIGGLVGNLAHWIAGIFVRGLGEAAATPSSYYGYYAFLALLILLSLLGLPCLHAIRKQESSPNQTIR